MLHLQQLQRCRTRGSHDAFLPSLARYSSNVGVLLLNKWLLSTYCVDLAASAGLYLLVSCRRSTSDSLARSLVRSFSSSCSYRCCRCIRVQIPRIPYAMPHAYVLNILVRPCHIGRREPPAGQIQAAVLQNSDAGHRVLYCCCPRKRVPQVYSGLVRNGTRAQLPARPNTCSHPLTRALNRHSHL